jgi:hypothetical protein
MTLEYTVCIKLGWFVCDYVVLEEGEVSRQLVFRGGCKVGSWLIVGGTDKQTKEAK